MTTSPFPTPGFLGRTIAGIALSKDVTGDLTHHIVTDTPCVEVVEVLFEVRP